MIARGRVRAGDGRVEGGHCRRCQTRRARWRLRHAQGFAAALAVVVPFAGEAGGGLGVEEAIVDGEAVQGAVEQSDRPRLKTSSGTHAGLAATVDFWVVRRFRSAGTELSPAPWPHTVDLDLQ